QPPSTEKTTKNRERHKHMVGPIHNLAATKSYCLGAVTLEPIPLQGGGPHVPARLGRPGQRRLRRRSGAVRRPRRPLVPPAGGAAPAVAARPRQAGDAAALARPLPPARP